MTYDYDLFVGRSAIPDALIFDRDTLLVVEIKLRHSADAFHQLERFYLPIVRKALPHFRVVPLEIVHFYDPRVRLAKPQLILKEPSEAFSLRSHVHPVLIADKDGRW